MTQEELKKQIYDIIDTIQMEDYMSPAATEDAAHDIMLVVNQHVTEVIGEPPTGNDQYYSYNEAIKEHIAEQRKRAGL